jgi:type IV pilus assembly protein PilW
MRPLPKRRLAGFTLTEVLIALAVGLIGITLMMRIMQDSESRKRSTAAGGDAQIAGSIGLYNLERDISLAGNGFGMVTTLGCAVTEPGSGGGEFDALIPVEIVDGGGTGEPDQLRVMYGNPNIMATGQAATITSGQAQAKAGDLAGHAAGDWVLAVVGSNCGMFAVVSNANTGPPDSKNNVTFTETVPLGSALLYNLGNPAQSQPPRFNVWAISGSNLTVADEFHGGAVVPIGEGIVNLQAEYGLDTNSPRDYIVDTWQNTAPGASDWDQVVAIRVGLLARSQQYEREQVTVNALRWRGGTFTMFNVDGTTTPPSDPTLNWRNYRYRVYEAVVPLRNIIWGVQP